MSDIRLVGIKEEEPEPANQDGESASQPTTDSEDCIKIAETKLREYFGINSKVERAHRDGRKVVGKPRHLLVKLLSYRDKVEVMATARDVLKNENFFIVDDLTKADLNEKRKWASEVKELYKKGTKLRFYAGRWRLRGGVAYEFNS